ncbi:ESCRT-III subunit protein did4 [Entomophthora muscae]|nr:ESCRT-III subunit protein did4 [Entomophthora muscae]
MKTQLQAVGLKIQTLRSTQQMSEAMKGATMAMKSMNSKLNLPGIQKVMMEFERESEIMDMKEEMMNDVIDDVMDDEMNEEEETDLIVSQVLDEIGISLGQSLVEAPSSAANSSNKQKVAISEGLSDDDALRARLDNLRRE